MSLLMQKLSARLMALPEHEQRQVLSFIDYLEYKLAETKQLNSKPPSTSEVPMKNAGREIKPQQQTVKTTGKTENANKTEAGDDSLKSGEEQQNQQCEHQQIAHANSEVDHDMENRNIFEKDGALILQFLRENGLLSAIEEEFVKEKN
jgi:hypothetical protein